MKTILSLSALALALAVTAPAFAQDAGVPVTKADCQKAKGLWDEVTQKCILSK